MPGYRTVPRRSAATIRAARELRQSAGKYEQANQAHDPDDERSMRALARADEALECAAMRFAAEVHTDRAPIPPPTDSWAAFLAARARLIVEMIDRGESVGAARRAVGFDDDAHVRRVYDATKPEPPHELG